MQKHFFIGSAVLLSTAGISSASLIISEAEVTTGQSTNGYFNFSSPSATYSTGSYASNPVPSMTNVSSQDLAYQAPTSVISGSTDTSASLLTNGPAQTSSDDPSDSLYNGSYANYSVEIDLGSNQTIGEFNTYSWQKGGSSNTRGPQSYILYAAPDGVTSTTNVNSTGWVDIGTVDTYSTLDKESNTGSYQVGVSFQDSSGTLGTYRYLVIDNIVDQSGQIGGGGDFLGEAQVLAAAVPEPASTATLAVLASGLLLRRRRRHA